MKKLLISMKVVENPNYVEVSNILDFEYIRFFEQLGFLVIPVPNNSELILSYFDMTDIDVVVLSGGNNVNPERYGGGSLTDVYDVRDTTEGHLMEEALKRGIPLIGICRGFQFINVVLGGKITHEIKNHVRKDHKLISTNSILNNEITNTYHNQGITKDDLADGLEVLAETEDGFIEAFHSMGKKVLGLQWHPERQDKMFDIEIIKEFLEVK